MPTAEVAPSSPLAHHGTMPAGLDRRDESHDCCAVTWLGSAARPRGRRRSSTCRGCDASSRLDFVVVNGENAAHGFGITDKICAELYAAASMSSPPATMSGTSARSWPTSTATRACCGRSTFRARHAGQRLRHLPPRRRPRGAGRRTRWRGSSWMRSTIRSRPSTALLGEHRLGDVDAILLDFHGEATSEKTSMGHFCDGRASAVIGTHSHVPTADYRILAKGTAYRPMSACAATMIR